MIQETLLSLWSAIKDIWNWNFAKPEKAKERIDICKECPVRSKNICTACGCFLPWKTKLENAKCPLEMW